MTKTHEMQAFDAFIASLPVDSYLHPWLSGIRDLVETDLRNDIIPDRTLSQTYQENRRIEAEARANATRIIEDAKKQAARIIEDAKTQAAAATAQAERIVATTRREFQADIHRLRHALDAVA